MPEASRRDGRTMVKRLSTLREIAKPWWVTASAALAALAGIWQFGCDQLGWPKLPEAWAMTGAYVPWWGWLLILQAIFVAALFEYVRRLPLVLKQESAFANAAYDDSAILHQVTSLQNQSENMLGTLNAFADEIKRISDLDARVGLLERRLSSGWTSQVEATERFVSQLVQERLVDVVQEIEAGISMLERQIENPGLGSVWKTATMQIRSGFAALGASVEVLEASIAARREAVETQNEFTLVRQSEQDRWQSGEQKKQWHFERIAPHVYKELLDQHRPVRAPGIAGAIANWKASTNG